MINEFIEIREEKQWYETLELGMEIKNWLMFFFSLIDLTQEHAARCLKELISGDYKCCVQNKEFLREKVSFLVYFM